VHLALVACVACASAAEPGTPGRLGPGDHELSLDFAGGTRHYRLHLPAVAGGRALPVLLAFHGGGGHAAGFQAYAGLDPVADREGFAVVYPEGSGRLRHRLLTWNAGGCCGRAMQEGVDDVGFVRAVLDDLAGRVAVDPTRVYATGHSNGGMLAYRLAAEASDRIAAVAPVAGATPLERFAPEHPVAVLHIHSVDDPRALYAGGLGPPFPLTRVRSLHEGVETQLARWAARNGCPAEAREVERRRDGSAAGHTATLLVHAPCASGAEVAHWRLTGAGHGWPGSRAQLPEPLVGPGTDVIDAAEEVWRFVRRFSRQVAAPAGG
jgi:polyhydroxybutyrate depolymerase